MAEKADRLRAYRNLLIEGCLTLRCPRCTTAFLDYRDCPAVTCANAACGAGFCVLCLAGESSLPSPMRRGLTGPGASPHSWPCLSVCLQTVAAMRIHTSGRPITSGTIGPGLAARRSSPISIASAAPPSWPPSSMACRASPDSSRWNCWRPAAGTYRTCTSPWQTWRRLFDLDRPHQPEQYTQRLGACAGRAVWSSCMVLLKEGESTSGPA